MRVDAEDEKSLVSVNRQDLVGSTYGLLSSELPVKTKQLRACCPFPVAGHGLPINLAVLKIKLT